MPVDADPGIPGRPNRITCTNSTNWLSMLEIVWAVWLADNLCYTKRKVVSRTCKSLRNMNREFRARRSAWFDGLMQALRVLPWFVKDRYSYEHRRRIEMVNTFAIKWLGSQDRKADRRLRFMRRLESPTVHITIEAFRDDLITLPKTQWTIRLNVQLTFTFSGAVLMRVLPIMYRKLSWYPGETDYATDSLYYSDSRRYQHIQLDTWEDLYAWITSPEFQTKPLDPSLVPGWQE